MYPMDVFVFTFFFIKIFSLVKNTVVILKDLRAATEGTEANDIEDDDFHPNLSRLEVVGAHVSIFSNIDIYVNLHIYFSLS